MFIKIIDDKPIKYSFNDLREDNPHTVFPDPVDSESLIAFDCFLFTETQQPQYDQMTHKLSEGEPVFEDGVYIQKWSIDVLTDLEKSAIVKNTGDQTKEKRRRAYQKYADPIYFQWKRGTKSEQDYLNIVEEIKQQLPYPLGYED